MPRFVPILDFDLTDARQYPSEVALSTYLRYTEALVAVDWN
jgi:hypothetical protein